MSILDFFGTGGKAAVQRLRDRLVRFRELVQRNDRVLALMAEAGEMLSGDYLFDQTYLEDLARKLQESVHQVVENLGEVTGNPYPELRKALKEIDDSVLGAMELRTPLPDAPPVLILDQVGLEHAEAAGGKMARLGEIRNRLGLSVPHGFVVTTWACWNVLKKAGVTEAVRALHQQGSEPPARPAPDPEWIQQRILEGELPWEVSRGIKKAVRSIVEMDEEIRFAVRSSATGEDGDVIAAGQFATRLGVRPDDVCEAYKEVVASLFSREILSYQKDHGIPPGQGLMAVGCMAMVPAKASGVIYSLDPVRPDREVQLVASSWGLGKAVVEGSAPVDRYAVKRSPDRSVLFRRIADKPNQQVPLPDGGIGEEPLPEEKASAPSVTDAELRAISEAACRVERYMKCAQDIEWALDPLGRVVILQARPLRIEPGAARISPDLRKKLEHYPVLLRGRGEVACRGIASGRVHLVRDPDSPGPKATGEVVLVARSASPKLGSRLTQFSAVITDVGNTTGHFAAVARETRIPTILDTGIGTSVLEEGQEVTVDAEENVVYQGRVDELLHYQLMKSASYEDAPEFRALRRMLKKIVPLNLHDPQSRDFAPDRCRTYHDVIRFAHEKAVASLTQMEWIRPSAEVDCVRRLDLPIPLDLILVDLGGGVRSEAEGKKRIELESVECRPLVPILEVLSGEGGWVTSPAEMDLNGFMSSATRALPLTTPMTSRPEQNLALISGEYLHLSLRLGYHFNVVDTYLTDVANDNYIYFRFLGGVTEMVRRSRRAELLRKILEHFGFVVEGRGDLVIGRTRGLTADHMLERMQMIGRLIGFTRQLDIYLRDDTRVDEFSERFLTGDGGPPGA